MKSRNTNMPNKPTIEFRVAVLGANKNRVSKVLSILQDRPPIIDLENEPVQRNIHVEYIPCIASFGGYKNEQDQVVKYLAKMTAFDIQEVKLETSLQTYFDEGSKIEEMPNGNITIPGIAAFAVGIGIDTDHDLHMIESYVSMMSGNNGNQEESGDGGEKEKILQNVIMCVEPNAEYASMKEENAAFKFLSEEEKEEAIQNASIGPGKMAKFIQQVARECIPESKRAKAERIRKEQEAKEKEQQELENEKEEEVEEPLEPMFKEYDVETTRYACKMCRTILFNNEEFEDPPHSQSQHTFSYRKAKGGNVNTSIGEKCQSYFLKDALNWMGKEIHKCHEGKLSCPKCDGKLGLYKWHGTQCSCGTW